MNLKEQLYVCTLAEEGSMSKAAKKLFISQPALSLYINNLEKLLGAKLFLRKGNFYTLTYIGEKYAAKAKEMLVLEKEFNAELHNFSRGSSGRLRIGVQLRRSPYIVAEIVSYFSENYPEVELVFTESNTSVLENMVANYELDLTIYSCMKRRSDLNYIYIFNDDLFLAVNSSSKLRRKAKWQEEGNFQYIDFKDLEDETFILPQKGQSLREVSNILFENAGIIPKKIIEIRNIETIMKLVSANFGVGFNRVSYINYMSHIKNIEYYNVVQDETPSELVIAYPNVSREIKNFNKMINSIKDIFSRDI
ncbi:LysR family transcriptional regulator [Clostridium polynesiense]|uniref:LysR family transcriptional regulator n=1 Tax=Clostridium polynesiense TaxID=1325933 RepID=UPI000693CD0C|nr:LysR family transcriptional regulator [Clostridium polynesiense]